MTPHIVVEADEVDRLKRQAMYAYVWSFLAQCIAFAAGWVGAVNWSVIAERFK